MCIMDMITYNNAGEWSFNNSTARDVIIFAIDNSSSSSSDNCKNNFQLLCEGPTFGINRSFSLPENTVPKTIFSF